MNYCPDCARICPSCGWERPADFFIDGDPRCEICREIDGDSPPGDDLRLRGICRERVKDLEVEYLEGGGHD